MEPQASKKEKIVVENYPGSSPRETEGSARAGQAMAHGKQQTQQVAHRGQEQASQVAEEGRQRARGSFQQMLQENPLAVGALTVGVGAAVGLAIPETEREHEVMGETRDRLVERGKERAQDAKERAQRVTEEAQNAAQQEADNQGLTQQ